jgi:hypothetical protein
MLHFIRSHHNAHISDAKSVLVAVGVMLIAQMNTVLSNAGVRILGK